MPRVSIVIITYNEQKLLPDLLASLARQTHGDFETIIVDSMSTDKTEDVARRYKGKIPRLRFHRMKSRGASLGRNTGAGLARGTYIIFLDADVVLHERFIEDAMHEMELRKLDAAAVCIRARDGNAIDRMYYRFLNCWFFLTQWFFPHCVGSCMISTKKAHRALGGFDTSIMVAEDNDYLNRARKRFRTGVVHQHVHVSARRFRKEGRWIALKYILIFLHRAFLGEIRNSRFNYRFAHYEND